MRSLRAEGVVVERKGDSMVVLKMARPHVYNCINDRMYSALAAAIEDANADDRVNCVMITGEGKYFTSGIDVEGAFRHDPRDAPVSRFMHAVINCSKLLIAAVNGPAVGIGTTMLLHMDLVMASSSSWFWVPFVRAGIVPEFASSLLFPELLGHAMAGRMLLLGDKVSCKEALRVGLIGEVVQKTGDDLVEHVIQRVTQATTGVPNGMVGILASKRLLRMDRTARVKKAIQLEFDAINRRIADGDTEAAMRALKGNLSAEAKL